MDGHSLFQALDNLSQTYTQRNIQSLRKYACTTHPHIYTRAQQQKEPASYSSSAAIFYVVRQTWGPMQASSPTFGQTPWAQPAPCCAWDILTSHLSCCSMLLTSRALNTPPAVPTKHSALFFLTPSHTPNLYLGFILLGGSDDMGLASNFSPKSTNYRVSFLPCNFSNGVRPSRPFWHLDKMLPACSTNHGQIGEFLGV